MLKKLILICAASCCLLGKSDAIEINQLLPSEFSVTQHWFSWTNDFSIATKEYKLGIVHRRLFSWSLVQYDFLDNNDQLQATGKMRWFSWGATFDVFDAAEQSLGRVEEKFSWFLPKFNFISPSNKILAEAQLNFWGTTYTVVDPISKETIAIMHRDFFRLKDDWTVKIVNQELFIQKELDPRLFVIVMAFQSDREEWQRQIQYYNNHNNTDDEFISRSVEGAVEENTENSESNFSELLEPYREALSSIEPAKEDFELVDDLVTSKLEAARDSEETEVAAETEFALILPLFEDEELTQAQKSALLVILEQHLNAME